MQKETGVVAHVYNPSNLEDKAGAPQIQVSLKLTQN